MIIYCVSPQLYRWGLGLLWVRLWIGIGNKHPSVRRIGFERGFLNLVQKQASEKLSFKVFRDFHTIMPRDKHRRRSSLSPDRREKRRRRPRGGPPRYEDLGKQANDVLGNGYNFGLLIKLDVGFRTKVSDLKSLLIRSRLRQQPELSFPLDAALTSSLARCPDTWRPSTR